MFLIQKRFTNPETFRKIRPDLLWAWLKESESYFNKRGLVLPPSGESLGADAFSPRLDYDALVRVFMEPTADMPLELVEGLHLVHEMGRPHHLQRMLDEARKQGLNLVIEPNDTPADVAMRILLLDQRFLENLHTCDKVTRPRSFEYFLTDASPLPHFEFPSLEQIHALEGRLASFYEAWQSGKGTRVFAFSRQAACRQGPEWLFLVRHGTPFRREEVRDAVFLRSQPLKTVIFTSRGDNSSGGRGR